MRTIVLLVGALLLANAAANVIDATDSTFDEVVKGEFVLMEFYAPWCGHCKKLEPEYAKAADELGSLAVLAKLDATKETVTAGKFSIQGFPTIKIFRDGVVSGDYEGGRTSADIVKYVKANVGPAVKPLVSSDELAKFKAENAVAVVAYLESPTGEAFDAFEAAAKKLRSQYAFGVATSSELLDGAYGDVILYKHFDENREVYAGSKSSGDDIVAFVASAGVPQFDEIGPQNYKMYLERKLPIVWLFTTPDDRVTLDAGRGAAGGFKGKLSFVWIDSSKYAGMAQRLGLSGTKFPALAIDNEGSHFAFPADKQLTTDAIAEFATGYLAGTLEATVRSETAPEPHTVEGLTTVVGSTFKELVEAADTNVFIEFYAPWCGHCKQLAPVFDAVAKALEDAPVRIAKIDATANDFNQKKFQVQGFPTLFFIPKDTHEPVAYEGERTEEALTKYIKERIA